MISFPFDNKSEVNQDRNVSSDVFAEYLNRMVGTSGIFAELGTKCMVTAGEGMTVTVGAGDGIIQGRFFIEESARNMQLESAGNLDRIDTIVARLDKAKRWVEFYVVKGTEATVPTAPALTRDTGTYELGLANIFVPKLTTSVSQQRITDTRLDSSKCGVVPVFGSVDTTALYTQIQDALNTFETESFAEFDAWFQTVKDQLSTDVAGNLQNQINTINGVVSAIEARITAEEKKVNDVAHGGTGKTTAEEGLIALGGAKLDVLWVNASPESSLGAVNIPIPKLNDYDGAILYARNWNAATYGQSATVLKGDFTGIRFEYADSAFRFNYSRRMWLEFDQNNLKLNDAQKQGGGNNVIDNIEWIPVYVVGIKNIHKKGVA